ncbi:MAG: hypothetical protein LJF06_18495 [Gemmatimonadetes bacterium]|jgi:hypothetical protein|nr:hypothetical protein [Gemmatimonadota bacterium]
METPETPEARKGRPTYRSHLIPRTRDGWIATVTFLVIFALAMPPFTHTVWDRLYPTILGMPFFYSVLLFLYLALIGVLIWAYRRGV